VVARHIPPRPAALRGNPDRPARASPARPRGPLQLHGRQRRIGREGTSDCGSKSDAVPGLRAGPGARIAAPEARPPFPGDRQSPRGGAPHEERSASSLACSAAIARSPPARPPSQSTPSEDPRKRGSLREGLAPPHPLAPRRARPRERREEGSASSAPPCGSAACPTDTTAGSSAGACEATSRPPDR
jgi:hypothetical protein